jgi:hypothetical protein
MLTINDEKLNHMDKEEALSKLKESIALRNKMGGAMYWNILNDKCFKIAEKCIELGAEREKVISLL